MEVSPEHPHDRDYQVNAPLQRLYPGELRDLALRVEELNPAPQVLEHRQEVVNVDVSRGQYLYIVELVHECDDLRQIYQLRDLQPLLFEQSARRPVTTEISDHRRPPLLEHELEEIYDFILEYELLSHLGGEPATRGAHGAACRLYLSVLHQHLQESRVGVASWGVDGDEHFLVAAEEVCENLQNHIFVRE